MTMEISDNPELQTHLVAQMSQGINPLDTPKQTDISTFKSLSGVSDIGDDTKAASLIDQFGNSKNTAASPEIYGAGHTQQTDRTGHSVPTQPDSNKIGETEDGDKPTEKDQVAADKADAKADAEAEKQSKISSLTSRIQQLQQQLSSVDVQISSFQSGESSGSGENPGAQLGQLSSQRSMLVSMIQSLQQQLSSAQAE